MIECSCGDMDCIDDGPKVYTEKIVTARKDYKCCECYGIILKGKRYHYFSGLWDYFEIYRTCLPCHTIRTDFFDAYLFGGLREYFLECMDFDYLEIPI